MRYHALACDYDNTLARDGRVEPGVLDVLRRVKASGRKLVLVTGRVLPDLARIFPDLGLFDRVVAENGALLAGAEGKGEKPLAEPPPGAFVDALNARGVAPLDRGRVIVATERPHETQVLDVIRALGLELQVIFNRDAVMVLPSGVNKATGLAAALADLGLSPRNTVAVGDAENDHALLAGCECAVAVANAVPSLRERADWVTAGAYEQGVAELGEALLADDLAGLEPRLARHGLVLGTTAEGVEVRMPPYGASVLIAGTSGGGKSTLATAFLEQVGERGGQVCIIDPEGDYEQYAGAVALGDAQRPPSVKEAIQLLEDPAQSASVNFVGLRLEDRPALFERLFAALLELRARTGHPHWILIDETHHVLPAAWGPAAGTVPRELHGLLMVTVHPDHVSKTVLSTVELLVAIGKAPGQTLRIFADTLGEPAPPPDPGDLPPGEAVAWRRTTRAVTRFRAAQPKAERRRHRRKYAEGELAPERSFYFRGPEGKLNLRAQNLLIFLQLAEGVDDATWLHHLRSGEIPAWFRDAIKDPALGESAGRVAADRGLTAAESRARIRALIEERYTAPE